MDVSVTHHRCVVLWDAATGGVHVLGGVCACGPQARLRDVTADLTLDDAGLVTSPGSVLGLIPLFKMPKVLHSLL
jgi:hypothetical protein